MTRFQFSLDKEEFEQMTFQIGKYDVKGEICIKVTKARFVNILSRALELKDRELLVQKSKEKEPFKP